MNKILGIIFMACCVAVLSSCEEDTNNPYDHTSSITILESNLSFDAVASQGVVKFASSGSVSVSTGDSWCRATLSGDSVIVDVDQNTTINGRSTVVTLRNGDDVQNVSVIQLGVIMQLNAEGFAFETDEAGSAKYHLRSNVALALDSYPDWVTAVLDGDSLSVTVTENTTGMPRTGYVKFVSGDFHDSLRVTQVDFDKSVAGKYKLYYKSSTGVQRSMTATVSANNIKLGTFNIPFTFDPLTLTFKITSGQYVGRSETGKYVYLCFASTPLDNGSYYWSVYYTNVSSTAVLDVAEDGTYTAEFGGMLSTAEITRFWFREFSKEGLSEANDGGTNMWDFYYPYLQRNAVNAAKSPYILR